LTAAQVRVQHSQSKFPQILVDNNYHQDYTSLTACWDKGLEIKKGETLCLNKKGY